MNRHKTLHEIFLANGGPIVSKWHHYFDIYERHLSRFVGTAPTMLEIGVAKGGSLRMWKEYFGPGTKMVGIDVNHRCKKHEAEDIEIVIGSQDDPTLLDDLLSRYTFDVVLDDGSHRMEHLNASFELIYDRMSPTGVYAAEDLHTCYLAKWGGGLRREGSFMETVKDKIDALHATYIPGQEVSEFTRSTASIHVYDSIVVLEKKPQGARRRVSTGAMGLLDSDFARE